ncbi:hypothetical protein ACFPH6_08830 [Streptomyces xiangluensis]|uniref:Peptidase inhibitor family I36 n=1 Tax=Streptomyces xiangluensis TaxID=2665720 RepID=A0ABV8YLJ1_9ACTN
MTRTKITTALAALGLTALTLSAVPGAAQASDLDRDLSLRPAAADAEVGPAANGYFYAYEHEKRGGKYCRWDWHSANWGSCSPGGNLRNQASSLQNSGYPGTLEDVNVYWGLNYTGAWYCLGNGRYLENIVHIRFGPNGGGQGDNESLNDNISSHKWSNSC